MKALQFLYSEGLSDCCNSRMLLVRSREGGFVSRNCLRCGKPDYVGQHHLPDLDCDFWGTRLGVRTIESNYFYLCGQCGRRWELPTVRPHWSELFEYSGLATDF